MKKLCFYLGTRLEAFEALLESNHFTHIYLFTYKSTLVYEKYKKTKKIKNLQEFHLILLKLNKESSLSILSDYSSSLNPNFIISVGFPYIISADICNSFKGRIFNLHPHILPDWPGYSPIKESFLMNQKIFGCTIHHLTSKLDCGEMILQIKADLTGMPLEEIYQKVFKEFEPCIMLLFLKNYFRSNTLGPSNNIY